MAIVMKTNRCPHCGSSEIETIHMSEHFYCRRCGENCNHLMPAADVEHITRIALLGGSEEEISALHNRYRNLEITIWSAKNRLQRV